MNTSLQCFFFFVVCFLFKKRNIVIEIEICVKVRNSFLLVVFSFFLFFYFFKLVSNRIQQYRNPDKRIVSKLAIAWEQNKQFIIVLKPCLVLNHWVWECNTWTAPGLDYQPSRHQSKAWSSEKACVLLGELE